MAIETRRSCFVAIIIVIITSLPLSHHNSGWNQSAEAPAGIQVLARFMNRGNLWNRNGHPFFAVVWLSTPKLSKLQEFSCPLGGLMCLCLQILL